VGRSCRLSDALADCDSLTVAVALADRVALADDSSPW
jgi:hypothetical protein